MDQNIIECGGFYFIHNFDSGNLGHVERVPTELIAPSMNTKTNSLESPDYEFNMWTRPDCAGTEFENGNRTWFYFGIQASEPGLLVRLNLINLNKQGKMYNQGMAPVTRVLPGKPQWERIRDRPVHSTDDNAFTLSFKYRTPENPKATTFFAFTYPFSFAELQIALNSIDLKMLPLPPAQSPDDIYYHRECLIYSLEGRRVDLLTITSHHGITKEKEERLKNLFPDKTERPVKFLNKKIIFISARVHPGETPSSFVFNGFLNLILTRNDPISIQLRKMYVFKLIPFLNPDGVARGHYRTDTRGVNLNRVYLNPSLEHHPTIFASRALIRYYHFGCEKEDDCEDTKSLMSRSVQNMSECSEVIDPKKKKGSNISNFRDDINKREKSGKPVAGNRSSTTIKRPSSTSDKNKMSATTSLVEQVYDLKLVEMPCQTSDTSSKASATEVGENTSLLQDSVLRSCLGSTVHVSTSEELNLQGTNPLRPLRDTLKNSISLLMETSSVGGDSSLGAKDSRAANVKIGWCRACRAAVNKLEDSMPGITNMVPGYSASMVSDKRPHSSVHSPSTTTYRSIDEYREHQQQEIANMERKLQDAESAGKDEDVYFCTNCFKRYVVNDVPENLKSNTFNLSSTSTGAVCGDSGDARSPPKCPAGDSDALPPPAKDEKPKSACATRLARKKAPPPPPPPPRPKEPESNLYLYIDLHGHASKKGIFMYGNHFEDAESCVECMLLPRIMSMNNLHFHFASCNFTERNMYLKDRRDGMSREGSGRVAVLKATGLVRSYTLECNYNTGRLVNVLPPPVRDAPAPHPHSPPPPPKYTPHIFEEGRNLRSNPKNLEISEDINPMKVGRSLGASILDLTGQHPNSRIPCSEHRNINSIREWLKTHTRMRPQFTTSRLRPKTNSPPRMPLYARSKGKVTEERKENAYVGAKSEAERRRSPPAARDLANAAMKFAKKSEPVSSASRTRYLADAESKPKALATAKRRNILAIRKPNSKTQVGVVKSKVSRRSIEEAESGRGSLVSAKLSKRSFARCARGARCRAMASSSSSEAAAGAWEDVAGGTALGAQPADCHSLAGKRRSFPNPSPSHLKKIRLKTAL